MRRVRLLVAATCLTFPAVAHGQSSSAGSPWNGEYTLVGSGFPEGDRVAQLSVIVQDSSCACFLQGPPGTLMWARLRNDTLRIVWSLPQDSMIIDIARNGDRVDGSWSIGLEGGAVSGTRKR